MRRSTHSVGRSEYFEWTCRSALDTMTTLRVLFVVRAQRVVGRFQQRQDGPVGVWKPHDEKGAPDREHRPHVLRVGKPRERKRAREGNDVAEPRSVEHAGAPEAIED